VSRAQSPTHTGLPSSNLGVGLSTVDNGAFEAPRPAPVPVPRSPSRAQERSLTPVALRRKLSLRNITGSPDKEGNERVSPKLPPLRSLSLSRKGSSKSAPGTSPRARADPRVVKTASPVGFSAMSFRWHIWSKVQTRKPLERAETPVGHLHVAGKSEPDLKTLLTETDEGKPPKKGLLYRLKS